MKSRTFSDVLCLNQKYLSLFYKLLFVSTRDELVNFESAVYYYMIIVKVLSNILLGTPGRYFFKTIFCHDKKLNN